MVCIGTHSIVPANQRWCCFKRNEFHENQLAVQQFENILETNYGTTIKVLALGLINLEEKKQNGRPLLEKEVTKVTHLAKRIKENLPILKAMIRHVYVYIGVSQKEGEREEEGDNLEKRKLQETSILDLQGNLSFEEIGSQESGWGDAALDEVEMNAHPSGKDLMKNKSHIYQLNPLAGTQSEKPKFVNKVEKNIKTKSGKVESYNGNEILAYLQSLPLKEPIHQKTFNEIQRSIVNFVKNHEKFTITSYEVEDEIIKQLVNHKCKIKDLRFLSRINIDTVTSLMSRRDVKDLTENECYALLSVSQKYSEKVMQT